MKLGAWFPSGRSADAPVRLFCLPHAGGSASAYREWPGDAELAILPLQPPGRETRFREAAHTRMADYLAELVPAIAPLLDRPYAVFGHSLGSLVGFELVRTLRRAGHPLPGALFASGCPAPRVPRRRLHDLPEPALIAELHRMGGLPAEVLALRDLLELVLPTMRADLAIADLYTCAPEPPLPCPITVLVGTDDVYASAADAAGWADETAGSFQLHELPGDHFFVRAQGAAVRALVRRQLLDR